MPAAMSGSTTSDPEGTRLYPVLVLLDANGHVPTANNADPLAADAGAATAVASPADPASNGVEPSASSWLLHPHALATQVIPAFAAQLAAAGNDLHDVVLLTREELENSQPKKKGGGAAKDVKKKKGEEMTAEEQYEAAHFSLSRDLCEVLRDRIEGELAVAREAMLERRRAEAEAAMAADPASAAGAADPRAAGKGRPGAKKPVLSAAAAAAAALANKKPPTPATGASGAGASPTSNSRSVRKSGSGSGKNSTIASRSASPGGSKPTTPRQGARPDSSLGFGLGATDPSAPSSSSGPRFPSSLPVHFVLFDLVHTVGDAARVQDVLNQCLDVCILLEDPALAAASAAARAASAESDAQEFLYGSPTGATTDSSGHPLSAVEQRLHREAREDAVARAPVPRPHPHDQTVYGVGAPAQEIKATPGSLLEALLREQKKQQQQAQSAGGAAAAGASTSTSFRNLVFLPVVLPEPTAAPTLGTSIAGVALATPPQAQQPPGSPSSNGRRSGTGAPAGSPSASSAGASSSAQKDGAAAAGAKRKPGAKGTAAPEQVAPPTAEQELVASTVQTLVLSLREFSAARADFERWASGARVVDMPAAPSAASTVDTRLYAHLLGQLPPGQVDVPTILYALFEQVAVNAPAPAAAQASAGAGAAGAGASPDTPAGAAGATTATPSAVDLSDFFAGEKLDELEEYMSRALERVTFAAGGAGPGHAHAHAGWAEKARALPPCPSALGGRHQFEGDSLGNGSGDASGSACCTICTHCGATEASLVLMAAESPLGGVVGAGQSFIPYSDELAQRRAEAALALGLPLEADSLSMAAEALLASHWPLPGVGRRGMPSRPDESALAQAGSEATTLLARASRGARASPAVVERALLLLEMEEMLMAPPPEFKFTHLAAADPAQEAVREVRVVPPLHSAASAGSGFAASPAAALASPMRASMTVRERAPGFSLYHVAHARSEAAGPVVEAAVAARMRELHCIAKARSGPNGGGGFGPGFGLRDESDSGEWRRSWGLESREYTEELSARVLAQRILRASLSPSGSATTTVRYRPLSDELIVAIATPLPLRRERDRTWSAYLAPNLSLAAWIASGPAVQRARPDVVYNYTDTGHTGQLAERVHTFYPLDQARVSMVTGQVSSSARACVVVEKDGVLLCMEQARIEDDEEAAKEEEEEEEKAKAQAAAAAAATAAAMEVMEEDEFHSSGRNSSRPGSSSRGDGTARSERDSARRGSASRERSGSIKKQLSSGSSSSASGAGAAPLGSGPAASLKKQGSAGPKTASSKKKALAEQKEADEAAALLAAQQAEAEAAARAVLDAEAAAQARLRAPPRHPRSAIILSARLSTGARMTFSGARGDGSNRATYTTRQGLVVELRGKGDEVYMKYPRSVLELQRGASTSPAALAATIQPVVPARKHGVPEAVAAAAAAAAAGSSNTAAVEFPLPPLVSPALSSELFRSVSPSGAVYRLHDDGCAYLLLPNGHVGFRGGNKGAGWVWTGNDGARVGRRPGAGSGGGTQVRLGGVEVARQYDAESGATVWTRADHAMFISYAGGSSLAQHADGTRIYTDDLEAEQDAQQGARELGEGVSVSPARRRVVVEHPRFPPITFTHHVRTSLREAGGPDPQEHDEEEGEGEEEQDRAERYAAGVSAGVDRAWAVGVQIAFPADGGHTKLTKHASTDAVSLAVRGGEELLALPQGRVVFIPPTFDRTVLSKGFTEGIGLTPSLAASRGARGEEQAALPPHLYDFDLTFVSSGRLRLADQEDNLFRLSCAGVAEMQLGRERNLDDQDEGSGSRGKGGDTIPASYYPLPTRPLPPRLFVVRADGGGYELLHDEEVNAFLARVDADPDTVCMPPEAFIDPNQGGSAGPASSREPVAVSMKYLTTLRAPPSYVRHPVIPNVVRAAPSALAAGSSLATLAATEPVEVLRGRREHATALAGAAAPALVYRHLVNQPVVTAAQKARVAAERAAFADWKESQRAAECRYDLDAARAGAAGRSPEQLREEERVAEEVARAKAALRAHQGATKSALAIHQEVALSEAAGGAGSGRPTSAAGRRTRPSTANAHRQPSSQHLLPRPLHEQDEAAKVVEQMVATLTAPPKTFFAAKAGGADAKQKQNPAASSRPGSASASAPEQQQQQQQQQQLGNFFAQPSFRRDFLLATLAQRMHDLAAPYLPGTRLREQEEQDQGQQSQRAGSGSGTQQSASEKEALWRSLDEQQRADYRGQYRSQLRLLVSHVADFLALASSFLTRAYSVPAREVLLQSEPYSTLLERAHPAFAGLVGSVAAVLGFERDCEKHVLTVSDAEFKLNAQALRRKMEEILLEAEAEADGGESGQSGPLPPAASAGKAAKNGSAEEKEKASPRDNQADADVDAGGHGQDEADFDDGVDYEAVVASLSGAERAAYTRTPAYKQYLSREARLRSIRATYSTQQHAPHGGSFQFRSAFAPSPAHLPPAPGRTSLPANPLPTAFDVTGAPRKQANRVALPAAHGPAAPAALNQRHLLAELQAGQPRPAPKTASTAKQSWHDSTAPFARFVLQPAELDLGPLRKGCTYRAVATLTNAGAVTGRFQVVQPPPRGGLDLVHVRAHYRPGLVAPGMQRRIEVEIYAGTAGPVEELVEVRSEQHVFHLPLRATVMHDGDYARAAEAGMVSEAAALQGGAAAAATGVPVAAAATTTGSVGSVRAPALNATYERDFPASPKKSGPAGPFHLTSSFGHPTKAGPAFSKNASAAAAASQPALGSTVPRGSFGQTGEIRMVAQGPTPHIAQALSKTQARGAPSARSQAHHDDSSEI